MISKKDTVRFAVYSGFAFEKEDQSKEIQTIVLFASLHRIPWRYFADPCDVPAAWIAVGTVRWCEAVLKRSFRPDYYPNFLKPLLNRRVWLSDAWPVDPTVFVKPADRYKRFVGRLASAEQQREEGPFWCSEKVDFLSEWRYYIAAGQVLASFGYAGNDDTEPPPFPTNVEMPTGWCGTVDLGVLQDGRLTLVEAHPPYAVGWYGRLNGGATYALWLKAGWQWLGRCD